MSDDIGASGGMDVPASPVWVRPADVMRARKFRAKRHALQARMSATPLLLRSQPRSHSLLQQKVATPNPFRLV